MTGNFLMNPPYLTPTPSHHNPNLAVGVFGISWITEIIMYSFLHVSMNCARDAINPRHIQEHYRELGSEDELSHPNRPKAHVDTYNEEQTCPWDRKWQ